MKHKMIFGTSDRTEEFEAKLDEFRAENKVSDKHFICSGRFLYMMYEYTPKSRNRNVGESTSTQNAEAGTSGAKIKDEGVPTPSA